jgi:pimeloyl-ACP methyl ester carboxylesterase/membrane protein DedA with SNARE-associated domain
MRKMWRWLRWGLLGAYLLALAASYYQRWQIPNAPEPLIDGKHAVTVQAVAGDQLSSGEVRIAFQDIPANGQTSRLPVVLIHGSPGASEVFDLFIEKAAGPRRLIVPDLPGFGQSRFVQSTKDLPDYSFRAHAVYVWQLLDRLGIQRAHLVGFSMGGGVVLNMAQLAPERVASVTMLSALGVQEMELLGDYHLNHAIHGVQLAGLWLLRVGLPRFGELNRSDMGVAYARNFYDSDQRPLRGILQSYAGPMLILHGRNDPLVPIESAYEGNRLVPQSEMHVLESNHFMVFQNPQPLIEPLDDFLNRVEAGQAGTRARAQPERVARAAQPMDTTHWPKPGLVTAFVLLLTLAAATFVSEDLACISAGVLVAEGRVSFLFAAFACFLGIVVGDVLLFLAGRWLGRPAVARAPLRWFLSTDALQHASDWLGRNGAAVIAASRFTPGTRLPTYFAAGVLHTPFRKFLGYFLLAAALWTPLIVGLSAGLGMPFRHSAWLARQPLSIKLLLGGVVMFVIARLASSLVTYRGRRGLARRWKRLTRWEFWPPYVFYPPVFVYIAYLGVKFRSPALFTAANPAIPASGFIGESKNDILQRLSGAAEWMPAFALIDKLGDEQGSEGRITRAVEVMQQLRLSFPVVLKPDAGQRGSGVAVTRSAEEMAGYLRSAPYPVILQEYVAGKEFGIFYYRYPDELKGRVFSITEKRIPVLAGDGKHTLEELILADDRAVCMSDFYLYKNASRAGDVPRPGENVQLVELGTHCRGAIFLDGSYAISPTLEEVIDKIARTFQGFYFGRFDVRVPSAEDLMAGRNLKVIELNGVTSEATHIYDPKLSIWQAYRVLFEQWRLAFEIGAQNRARGAHITSPLELLKMLREYRTQSREHPE